MKLAILGPSVLLLMVIALVDSAALNKTKVVSPVIKPVPKANLPTKEIGAVKNGLEAMSHLVKIFNVDGFLKISTLPFFSLMSNTLSTVLAIFSILGPGSESAEMKFMREQFQRVHSELDRISLQLDSVKNLIQWQSAKVMYANCETTIIQAGKAFNAYVTASPTDRNNRKKQFLEAYRHNLMAAKTLYHAIVDTEMKVAENLAAAAIQYTHNHRRQVMDFLLGMNRLILRGAELDIAYEKITRGIGAAKLVEKDWKIRTLHLVVKMKAIDKQIVESWIGQMHTDVNRIAVEHHGLNNEQFASHTYKKLSDKYFWRHWIVLAYKDVGGFDNHALNYPDGGYHLFRTHGHRNIVVASADPNTSTFTHAKGDHQLAAAENARPAKADAAKWLREIESRIGGWENAALRAVICYDCDVHWKETPGRLSHRKLVTKVVQYGPRGITHVSEKFFHALLFG